MAVSRRARGVRLAACLVGFLLASCEQSPQSEAEVALRVLANEEWMADADTCPADLMPTDMRVEQIADFKCSGAEVPGCYQRCKRNDVDACYWLAYAVQQSEAGIRASESLYQRACKLGEPSGCVNRAASMLRADSSDPDVLTCTARTFGRACDLDDIWGCSMLGLAYGRGLGVPLDPERAAVALRKACARPGDATHEACTSATQMLQELEATSTAAPPN
jgi:hypothetical protein